MNNYSQKNRHNSIFGAVLAFTLFVSLIIFFIVLRFTSVDFNTPVIMDNSVSAERNTGGWEPEKY